MIEALYSKFLESSGVSTDTRTIQENNLFFALSGSKFNGNKYAKKALEKGALAAIVDEEECLSDKCLLVEDSLRTLQNLAAYHRLQFSFPVLAITGSNGKTTTRELCKKVLSKKYKVQATEGNLNNHIGIPLTILNWKKETEFAIVEMGANHQKEIAGYCEYTRPTHGIITNIGHAHTEGFGGIEGVLVGKSELFDFLKKTRGIPFINQLDERLNQMIDRFSNAVVFPDQNTDPIDSKEYMSLKIGGELVKSNLTGDHNFSNAAVAVVVGRYFDIHEKDIKAAITEYVPNNQRSQIIKKEGRTIIMDAYNANPDSMKAALKNLSKFDGKKTAIIGDMNELSNSQEAHRSLGDFINIMKLNQVFLIGKKIKPALEKITRAEYFPSTDALIDAGIESDSDVFLLKASRSIRLEKVLEIL